MLGDMVGGGQGGGEAALCFPSSSNKIPSLAGSEQVHRCSTRPLVSSAELTLLEKLKEKKCENKIVNSVSEIGPLAQTRRIEGSACR